MTEGTGVLVSATRVERPVQIMRACAVWISATVLAGLALPWPGEHPSSALSVLLFVAGIASLVVAIVVLLVAATRYRRIDGTLRVSAESLEWRGRPVFGRGIVKDAIAYLNGKQHGVRVQTRWRTAHFEVGSADEADRIVTALGKDSGQAAVSFAEGAGAFTGMAFLGGMNLLRSWLGVLALVTVAVLPPLVMLLLRTRWLVGSDGLLIKTAFGRDRFIPYPDVTNLTVRGGMIDLTLRDQSHVTLRAKDDTAASEAPVVGVGAVARRLGQARAAAAERRTEESLHELLARGNRDIAAWITELNELEARPATYRVAPVRREALWSTLADATQPAEVRAAAAMALRPRLADDERGRLRVMAAACASPKLRVALEATSMGDEARLAAALEDVSGDEGHEAARVRRAQRDRA